MNGCLRKWMCFLFMLTIAWQYAAAYAPAEAFEYAIDNDEVTITKFIGDQTEVSIPPTIEGKPVVAIGEMAFYENNSLISVTIPEGVTVMGEYAFSYCRNMTSITIPSSMISIANNALYFCRSLTSVTIPPNVTSIGNSVFYACSSLTSVTIPSNMTSIGEYLFCNCSSLTSVTIPPNVTSIGEYAFYGCSSLTSVTIPPNVTSIGDYAFSGCSITEVVIPASVDSIGNNAFNRCSSLFSINVDSANTNYTSDDGILFNKSKTTLVRYPPAKAGSLYSIPNNVTNIGRAAFNYCTNLTTITIPGGVISIKNSAFEYCTSLQSVIIEFGVTSIGNYAFYNCASLTSIVIPSSMTTISRNAFLGCSNLAELYFCGAPPEFGNDSYPTPITFSVPADMGWENWEAPEGVTVEIRFEGQVLELVAGWNWIGFTALPESRKVSDVLGTTDFTFNDAIQTNDGTARFNGTSWMPGSLTIEYGKLYQIYVAHDVEVNINGMVEGPSSIPLRAGWNWIANSALEDAVLSQLTHSGGWTAGDRIQSPDGSATYTGDKWVPAGFMLESGKGYQIYTANGGTLTFPTVNEENALYAVVDLSGGPDATNYPVRYTNKAPHLDDDTCRTTELWLRRIPAGTFIMGSPEDELGRVDNETQHEVMLTQDYYMGVFECTQKQWELVMGSNPSEYVGDCRPVEQVSYDMIRGTGLHAGAGWPTYGHAVDAASFMGKLQTKTGLTFDLPTEAQWEYACRAGTTTALNSGKNLTDSSGHDIAMDEVGRYGKNIEDGKGGYSQHTKVGSYLPNAWGLYDMHGNVREWCLDWYMRNYYATSPNEDPTGSSSGTSRTARGSGWYNNANYCRSAFRYSYQSSYYYSNCGFRIACLPLEDLYVVVDLSGGPDAASYPVRYTDTAPNLDDDNCRTTELWLRKIRAGTFTMGSPSNEVGRQDNETQHKVTLTKDYYMGVFECTQKQWELVMGDNPSSYQGDCRPVVRVSYDMIRGTSTDAGAGWPVYGHVVDSASFMGKLQEKTGLVFDLPTEAQWEYACRAGTTTALNSGKNLASYFSDANVAEVGRCGFNQSDGKGGYTEYTKVGSYLPNAWGLYDMHGNVYEWCLDWWGGSDYAKNAVSDPLGMTSGSNRVTRSGGYSDSAYSCRSAFRGYYPPSYCDGNKGLRVVCLP